MLVLPPPFNVPPHLTHPSGQVRVWLTDPPGMLDSFTAGVRFTADHADWLVGPVTSAMLALGEGPTRYRFIHDWSGVQSYDASARVKIIDWGRSLRGRISRIDITVAPDAPALFRMAVAGGTMAMSVIGVPCFVNPNLREAITASALRPAAR